MLDLRMAAVGRHIDLAREIKIQAFLGRSREGSLAGPIPAGSADVLASVCQDARMGLLVEVAFVSPLLRNLSRSLVGARRGLGFDAIFDALENVFVVEKVFRLI